MSETSKMEHCDYAELNRANGIICVPLDKCVLCKKAASKPGDEI